MLQWIYGRLKIDLLFSFFVFFFLPFFFWCGGYHGKTGRWVQYNLSYPVPITVLQHWTLSLMTPGFMERESSSHRESTPFPPRCCSSLALLLWFLPTTTKWQQGKRISEAGVSAVSQAALAHILLSGLLEMKAPAVHFSFTIPFCSFISLSLLPFHTKFRH